MIIRRARSNQGEGHWGLEGAPRRRRGSNNTGNEEGGKKDRAKTKAAKGSSGAFD